MEIVEIKCEKCGKEIYVQEGHLREKMFCTLGCLGAYMKAPKSGNNS